MNTVYDWLDEVRARPGMYFTELEQLETMIHGYLRALSTHRIDEGVPSLVHFPDWLRRRTGWSMSCGWADAFRREVEPEVQVKRVFGFLDEFRLLRPSIVASVILGDHHTATGKRVVIGMDGRMARPEQAQIVEYAPESLQFLRFVYPERLETQRVLMSDARKWMEDEFGVQPHEWVTPQRT